MEKIILSGKIIEDSSDSFHRILLENENGYKIDLINRFKELTFNGFNKIQVNYHVSENKISLDQAKEENISKIAGGLNANYEVDDYSYSSWTFGTDYNSNLEIGNHNLYRELSGKKDKYVIFEINKLENPDKFR